MARMTVIPFPGTATPEPLAFAIGARVDLRVGAVTSGVVRPRGEAGEAFAYSNLARLLRAARMTWRDRAAHASLTLAVPGNFEIDADVLSEAATEAGCTKQRLSFELCERWVVATGGAVAEDLRARGWGVVLRGDPECPLPFGARARSLYIELTLPAPQPGDPDLAINQSARSPLGRRLLAAKAAGIAITAENVVSRAHAKTLAMAGFDRGGGPHAEARLR